MKKTLGIKGAEPFRFKIVNYNVLAQAMMTEQSYNFQQHNPDHLEWEYRAKCIQEEIDHIGDPEIICLQVILIILISVRWRFEKRLLFCILLFISFVLTMKIPFLQYRKWPATCTVRSSCRYWRCAVIWACSVVVSLAWPRVAPFSCVSTSSDSSTPNRFPSRRTSPSSTGRTSDSCLKSSTFNLK